MAGFGQRLLDMYRQMQQPVSGPGVQPVNPMVNFGMRMMAGGGPSPVKRGIGQIMGEAGLGTMNDLQAITQAAYQNAQREQDQQRQLDYQKQLMEFRENEAQRAEERWNTEQERALEEARLTADFRTKQLDAASRSDSTTNAYNSARARELNRQMELLDKALDPNDEFSLDQYNSIYNARAPSIWDMMGQMPPPDMGGQPAAAAQDDEGSFWSDFTSMFGGSDAEAAPAPAPAQPSAPDQPIALPTQPPPSLEMMPTGRSTMGPAPRGLGQAKLPYNEAMYRNWRKRVTPGLAARLLHYPNPAPVDLTRIPGR